MHLKDFDIFPTTPKLKFSASTHSIKTNTGALISLFSILVVLSYGSELFYKMSFRLKNDIVQGTKSYNLMDEGLVQFDRFQGSFDMGVHIYNQIMEFDIFDNPYIAIRVRSLQSPWIFSDDTEFQIRKCNNEEGKRIYGQYYGMLPGNFLCFDDPKKLRTLGRSGTA